MIFISKKLFLPVGCCNEILLMDSQLIFIPRSPSDASVTKLRSKVFPDDVKDTPRPSVAQKVPTNKKLELKKIKTRLSRKGKINAKLLLKRCRKNRYFSVLKKRHDSFLCCKKDILFIKTIVS